MLTAKMGHDKSQVFFWECSPSGGVLIKFIKSFLVTRLFQMSFVLVFFLKLAICVQSVPSPSHLFCFGEDMGERDTFPPPAATLFNVFVCGDEERVEIFMWFSNFGLAFCLLLVLYGRSTTKEGERERERVQVINHWKQWQ